MDTADSRVFGLKTTLQVRSRSQAQCSLITRIDIERSRTVVDRASPVPDLVARSSTCTICARSFTFQIYGGVQISERRLPIAAMHVNDRTLVEKLGVLRIQFERFSQIFNSKR